MSFLSRRCIINVNNINRSRKAWTLLQSERHHSHRTANHLFKYYFTENHFKWKYFHTSQTVNKVVAFKLSDIGEGIREVVIKEWFVNVGDKVQQFDNICEVQSDKAAVTITSRYDGVISKLYHKVDQIAMVGQPLIDIDVQDTEDDGTSSESEAESTLSKDAPTAEHSQRVKVLTTPAVRRIAAQFQVDLSTVKATGRNGRILKEDMLAHLNINAEKSNEIPDITSVKGVQIPITKAQATVEVVLEDRIEPVTGFIKGMVKSMTEAMKIPHFVFSDEYNVTKLVETRDTLKNLAKDRGVKLTYMPLIVKAASLSLSHLPILNSSLDSSCENIIFKARHNIGVAMDTPQGLVVPVIKNVQSKTILEIAQELNELQNKGLKGQLGLHHLTDGTFTISNIGIVGGTYTKPVILPPQVSIGAFGKIRILPRFDSEGNVVKAHILTVSWSADHRVVDGVTMARYSNYMKQYLENPYTLLLEL